MIKKPLPILNSDCVLARIPLKDFVNPEGIRTRIKNECQFLEDSCPGCYYEGYDEPTFCCAFCTEWGHCKYLEKCKAGGLNSSGANTDLAPLGSSNDKDNQY